MKPVIIPIETKVREFHSKLLFSCVLAEHGFPVIFGGAQQIRAGLPYWPRGLFMDKSIAPSRAQLFANYRQWGHRIAAWCEEGLTIVDEKEYLPRKINAEAMGQIEKFFAWGPYQAGLVGGKCINDKDKIVTVGNPRIDLLRAPYRETFNEDVEKLNDRFGRFILINTNFSLCNHHKGEGAFMRLQKKAGKLKTPEDEAFARGWVAHKTTIFNAFKSYIPKLCEAVGDVSVIIRPHPSENHNTWVELAESFDNCHVIHEGNVVPWIIGSDVIIHNGCTTGIEAWLLDKPVLAYQPITNEVYDAELPNRMSERVFNEEDLLQRTQEILAGKNPLVRDAEQEAFVRGYIAQIDGDLSADCIAKELSAMEVGSSGMINWILASLRRLLMRIKHPVFKFSIDHDSTYHNQKFPGLSLEEVQDAIGLLKQCSGRFENMHVKALGNDCFRLQAGKTSS